MTQCQCSGIRLSVEETAFIGAKYENCLCIGCLHDLQKKYEHFKAKYILKNNSNPTLCTAGYLCTNKQQADELWQYFT
ncbi:MAG: hypothetical protein IPL50_11865 [Chitinophagaceae bacterium]|nr:hypothetical protein [Chitinophagaceae bacterium]